jgi:predicted ester cyclase
MHATKGHPGREAENKEVFRRFQDKVFHERDLSEATLSKYLHPDFIDHSSWPGTGQGTEGLRSRLSTWQAAFSETTATNLALVSEGVMLAVLYELRAYHTGDFVGIAPTNEPVFIPAIDFFRIEDGQIYERWSIYDYLTTALQVRAEIHLEPAPQEALDTDPRGGNGHPRMATPINFGIEAGREDTSKGQQNKAALFRFQKEVFNANDWSIETLGKHLSPEIIDHNAYPGDPPGLYGVQSRFSAWQAAFNDPEEDNVALAGEGDLLAVLYNLHAFHSGAFMGVPATHRHVVIPGIEFVRFEEGLIAEHWGIYDFKSTAQQIGTSLTLRPRDREEVRYPNQSVSARQKRRPFALLHN